MTTTADRIKELIESLQLSNVEFAKRTKLNPATVSHILSGRNKASLQVIENIKTEFTDVNLDYLINGEGELFRKLTDVIDQPAPSLETFPTEGLRVATVGSTPPSPPEVEIPESKPVETQSSPTPNPTGEKQIERIVIFYSDGSFTTHHP